jgi:hypothetical protein
MQYSYFPNRIKNRQTEKTIHYINITFIQHLQFDIIAL